tara:strand:+ start:58245 stop:58484 length:240 start_codon:yes stop_codon:yes gene_type:complete
MSHFAIVALVILSVVHMLAIIGLLMTNKEILHMRKWQMPTHFQLESVYSKRRVYIEVAIMTFVFYAIIIIDFLGKKYGF